MTDLPKKIYYVDRTILDLIQNGFMLVDKKDWYELYVNKSDNSFWRLDAWDKYQEQFFLKLESKENWTEFDGKELMMDLLLETRGTSDEVCVWKDCKKSALNGLAYCVRHAYEEVGIRK